MRARQRAFFELHLAVFLYGFTAILGDLIQLSATVLVWWRVLLTSLSLWILIGFGRRLRGIPARLWRAYAGIGVLIAIHWITFFASVKYANASVALVCFATCSFFTSILEPLIMRTPFAWHELLVGALVIPGMWLVVQGIDVTMWTGVWLGLFSTVVIALFSVLNKRLIHDLDTPTLTFIEMSSAWLFISCGLPFFLHQNPSWVFWPVGIDWFYLAILALVCTTFALVLNLRALKELSAFTTSLTYNLEPVYGILLAVFLLNENRELGGAFYAGVGLILASVFGYPFFKKWRNKHKHVLNRN